MFAKRLQVSIDVSAQSSFLFNNNRAKQCKVIFAINHKKYVSFVFRDNESFAIYLYNKQNYCQIGDRTFFHRQPFLLLILCIALTCPVPGVSWRIFPLEFKSLARFYEQIYN